jgi:protein involved in plasmid replication-relaxation
VARRNPTNRHRSKAGATPRVSLEVLADLVHRLTPRDRAVLELVWEHRVLTTHQLAATMYPTPGKARHRLLELHRLSALERFQPWTPVGTMPWHWVLGPGGAHVLAGQRGIDVADLGYRRTTALAICHSTKLGHQIGVNEFFTQLHAYARRRGDGTAVAEWWPERRCAALWGDLTRPDAYGRWVQAGAGDPQELDFFLEYDTGSETLRRVVDKLAGYTTLADSTGISTPVLLWLPSRTREVNLRKLLGTPETPVATAVHTASTDLEGPAGPIWLPADSAGPRRRLIELADHWPISRKPTGTTPNRGTQPQEGRPQEPGEKPEAHPREQQERERYQAETNDTASQEQ